MTITWEVSQRTNNIDACSNNGVTDSETSFGSINGIVQFIRFRVYEAKYDSNMKGVCAYIKSEQILPVTMQ